GGLPWAPGLDRGSELPGAVVTAVEDDQDSGAVRPRPGQTYRLADAVFTHQLGPGAPDRPVDAEREGIGDLNQPPHQDREGLEFTVAFDDGLDVHAIRSSNSFGSSTLSGPSAGPSQARD